MNKMISAALIGSIAMGGLNIAIADDDDYREKHRGEYCLSGDDKHKKGHHKKGMEYKIKKMAKHLDLSDEQTSKIRAILDKHSSRLSALRSQMKTNKLALRESIHADTQDMAAIEKLAKKQGELKSQKIMIKANIKSSINQILSTEQRKQMQNRRFKGERYKGKHCKHD